MPGASTAGGSGAAAAPGRRELIAAAASRRFGVWGGGGARLGWVGDLGFGGGSGGCCVGSWSCVVFAGAVGCRGGFVGVVSDAELVVEQDRGLAADAGRLRAVRQCLW